MSNTGKVVLITSQDKNIPINIIITYVIENEPKRVFFVYKKIGENLFEKMIPKVYIYEEIATHTTDDFISFDDLGDEYSGSSLKKIYPEDWRVNIRLIQIFERFKYNHTKIIELPVGTKFRVYDKGGREEIDVYTDVDWFTLLEQKPNKKFKNIFEPDEDVEEVSTEEVSTDEVSAEDKEAL